MFRKVANFNYFDNINSPEKAYWLGFIWADGYIAKRERPRKTGSTRLEYNLKLALKKEDSEHLEKFINCLESDYEIHHYKTKGFGMTECIECRIFITNVHMCGLLYEKLGIFPHRYDISINKKQQIVKVCRKAGYFFVRSRWMVFSHTNYFILTTA